MSKFLQRLELHGFKSFQSKVSIDFLDGVTVIVGPNGCGKSNVLDGLKWVLGETSAKSLRGGKMADVLFRGSAGHKPSGMAQVTLTCNNAAGTLPVDASEVSIQRRLFANGDSEYYANKARCRMRDVHELFMDTGLGADGYSVIEQGRIGELVAARPEQRREIFEEAAGISRYKARREETLRKLVRTEEDLVRLFDHISEVEKSAGTLYRQAKKAERFRRLVRRLRRVQKRALHLRWQAATAAFAESKARFADAKSAFEAAAAELATVELRETEARQRLDEFQRDLQQRTAQLYERQNALAREQHQLELVRQRRQSLAERATALERERESAGSRVAILDKTLVELEAQAAAQTELLRAKESELRAAQQELDEFRRALDGRRRAGDTLRGDLARLEAKRSALENDQRLASALVAKLEGELSQHGETVERLRAEADESAAEAERHRSELERVRGDLQGVVREREEVRAAIGQSDKAREELSRRVDELQRRLQQAASRHAALQELEDSFEGYFKGVKEVMLAASNGRLKGIVGVVSNLIEVPGDYDVAMEVALGGDLQDIVTQTVEQSKAAIRFLKEHNLGRATFLPLDFLHADFGGHGVDRILGRRGVVGLARDLVKYDKSLEPAVRYLFGNTIVVEHLDVAVDLEREGMRQRYVTLQGDIVNPRGVLSGGSHKTKGLLTRAREIAELRALKSDLERQAAGARAELQSAKDRHGELHARAAALQARQHELQMAEARAEKDVQAAEARRRDRRNAFAVADARAVQQREDRRRHTETIANCEEALAAIRAQLEEMRGRLDNGDATLREDIARLEAAGEAAATLRVEVGALRERDASFRGKLADLVRDRDRAREEIGGRAEERRRLDAELEKLALEAELGEEQIAKLVGERDTLKARVDEIASDNAALAKAANEARAAQQELLRRRNERDNTLRAAEIRHAELRVEVESVEREAADEFGMTLEEIAAELAAKEVAESAAIAAPDGSDDGEGEEPSRDELADDEIANPQELRRLVTELKERIQRLGPVNEAAIEDYAQAKERLDFLTAQRDDLVAAKESLRKTIAEIDETTRRLFDEAYATIRGHFVDIFRRLFSGGKGDLILVESETQPEPGIEIWAQPPGKNIGGSITLMSGGEKALTAIALMLALFQFRPSPICVLDEVDAPLDDANVQRFCNVIKEFSHMTQFLIITHNKITMSLADTIYGVTMQEPGVSKVVSVRFDKIEESGLLESAGAG
ncbi:MAG: chromosome segregation protein SMC [Candidatus Sumerlaeia bacterium]|nr:chromosome segregation protein SMC [Candidatus Sumerlaeia bacterium]